MRSAATIQHEYEMRHEEGMSDAHCHINLFDDPQAVVNSARESGVKTIVTAGGNLKDNLAVDRITSQLNIFGVIGIGPDVAAIEEHEIEKLKKIISQNKYIVGIGEVGLDFKISQDPDNIAAQKEVFIKQIELSRELDVPLVIHARKAIREVIGILIDESVEKAMFHFFEGGLDEARIAEKNGYLISIPPLHSAKRRRVIENVEIGTLVTETDAPVAGSIPNDVKKSIEYIAQIKGMSIDDVARKTSENVREFFYI